MFKTIVTERIVLRQPVLTDADVMFSYRTDPGVAKYQSWQPDHDDLGFRVDHG